MAVWICTNISPSNIYRVHGDFSISLDSESPVLRVPDTWCAASVRLRSAAAHQAVQHQHHPMKLLQWVHLRHNCSVCFACHVFCFLGSMQCTQFRTSSVEIIVPHNIVEWWQWPAVHTETPDSSDRLPCPHPREPSVESRVLHWARCVWSESRQEFPCCFWLVVRI